MTMNDSTRLKYLNFYLADQAINQERFDQTLRQNEGVAQKYFQSCPSNLFVFRENCCPSLNDWVDRAFNGQRSLVVATGC